MSDKRYTWCLPKECLPKRYTCCLPELVGKMSTYLETQHDSLAEAVSLLATLQQ